MPAEHGSWSWLLVPFLVGIGVAGRINLAVLLVLTGGLSGFLLRQPATAWLRVRRGRGRRSDEKLAAAWTIGLTVLASGCLAGLLLLGHASLLWLLPPLVVALALYLGVAHLHRARVRNLWMELAGAAALAAMAPAAYAAAAGRLGLIAWMLWIVMALQNALSVLYVRQRLADTRKRLSAAPAALVGGHLLGLMLVAGLAGADLVPTPVVLPFAGLMLRALWAVVARRPLDDVKRFGFSEVGVEVIIGLWVVAAYLLQ